MMYSSAYASIAALDLSTVCTRLMHPHAGYGWSEARTRAAEQAYREFLQFAKTFPAETPSPTADVDAFWHFHILDTLKYARDCAMAFGYFLHHKPDLTLGTPAAQAASHDQTLAIMREALAAGGISHIKGYCAASNEALFQDGAPAQAYCAISQLQGAYCAIASAAERDSYCAVASAPVERAYCAVAQAEAPAAAQPLH
jgi:hypothetical protein